MRDYNFRDGDTLFVYGYGNGKLPGGTEDSVDFVQQNTKVAEILKKITWKETHDPGKEVLRGLTSKHLKSQGGNEFTLNSIQIIASYRIWCNYQKKSNHLHGFSIFILHPRR